MSLICSETGNTIEVGDYFYTVVRPQLPGKNRLALSCQGLLLVPKGFVLSTACGDGYEGVHLHRGVPVEDASSLSNLEADSERIFSICDHAVRTYLPNLARWLYESQAV